MRRAGRQTGCNADAPGASQAMRWQDGTTGLATRIPRDNGGAEAYLIGK